MNRSPFPKQAFAIISEKNPWEDTEHLPTLSTPYALLLSLISMLCATYPTVCDRFPTLWWLPILCCAPFYLRTNRTPYGWLLLAAALLSGALLGSLELGVILFCVISTLTITAFLHTTTRHPLLILLPIIAYTVAVLLTRDPVIALFATPAYPAAYIMGRSIMSNERRVSTIASSALVLGGVVVFAVALLWRLSDLEMSMQALLTVAYGVRDEIVELALTDPMLSQMRVMLESAGYDIAATFSSVFDFVLMLVPGVICVLFLLISYAAQYLCVMSYPPMKMKQFCTVLSRRFTLSVLSAVIFVVCAVVALFPSSRLTLFSAVTQNLFLILFPGMLVAGFWSLYASYRNRPYPFYLILALVFGAIMPHILLVFVALSGATATLTRPLLLKIMVLTAEQNGKPGDHDQNQDPPAQS